MMKSIMVKKSRECRIFNHEGQLFSLGLYRLLKVNVESA